MWIGGVNDSPEIHVAALAALKSMMFKEVMSEVGCYCNQYF